MRLQRRRRRYAKAYLGGFCSFHGSLTFGIVSNSILASLPSFSFGSPHIDVLDNVRSFAGSIEIGPRGLFAVFQLVRNFIASSPVNLPLVSLIRSKIADIPSQPSAER